MRPPSPELARALLQTEAEPVPRTSELGAFALDDASPRHDTLEDGSAREAAGEMPPPLIGGRHSMACLGEASRNLGVTTKTVFAATKLARNIRHSRSERLSTTRDLSLKWGEDDLPSWAFDQTALDSLWHLPQLKQAADASCLAAWRCTAKAIAVEWGTYFLMPAIAYSMASCNFDGRFAGLPQWLLPILLLPMVSSTLILEWKCLKYLNPVTTKALGAYTLRGRPVPYHMYLIFSLGVSTMGRLDLLTSGMVSARVVKTCQCHPDKMTEIWSTVVSRSLVPWLPGLTVLACAAWGLMCLQLLLALTYGIPFRDGERSIKCLLEKCEVPSNGEVIGKTSFRTLVGETSCYQATVALAEASRFNALTFRHAQLHIKLHEKHLGIDGIRFQWINEVQKLTGRICVTLLLEIAPQTNFQASVLALTKAAKGRVDRLTIVSIVVGVIMGCYNLFVAVNNMLKYYYKIKPHMQHQEDARGRAFLEQSSLEEREEQPSIVRNSSISSVDRQNGKKKSLRCRLYALVFVFSFAALSTLAFLVYALLKTYMATVCKRGVWNMALPLVAGCVEDLHTHNHTSR